jgi:hypothetical protein
LIVFFELTLVDRLIRFSDFDDPRDRAESRYIRAGSSMGRLGLLFSLWMVSCEALLT